LFCDFKFLITLGELIEYLNLLYFQSNLRILSNITWDDSFSSEKAKKYFDRLLGGEEK
jgi:hypothetical protein